ncbi:cell division protein DivIC [Natronobacillus azotifigens]|uniref:Septum formation initiator family protein n=1 Tax=Natronobacillus azotifigens TaxID=472978 RepID=A0A9J6RD27_9BACI|nr:septum formation initiator family protein [Natronobacillus azotifigens]MCZ0703592.1 septum formation initiator family protein [Natronobacillus azotifigens]
MGLKERKVSRINSTYMNQYDAHMERQRKKKRRLRRRLTLFAVITIITFASILIHHTNQRAVYTEKEEAFQVLQKRLELLENEEKDLLEEIRLLEDESYVLQIARTNYFFTEEGEIIFNIPEENPAY